LSGYLGRCLSWGWPVAGLISLLALWQAVIVGFGVRPFIAPGPLTVMRAIWDNRLLLWTNLFPTASEAILGFLIGNAIGFGLATLFVHSELVRKTYFPIVVLFNTIPIIALSPILILVFGLTMTSKVAVAAIVCMFPTLVNTLRGFESVSHSEMELMRVMAASPAEIFFRLRLPKSLPFVFTALRIAATSSVIGAIISEWVGAENGIGMLIIQATFDYRTELLYASIAVSSALALALFGLIALLENYFIRWRAR
jgi:NitT/TauT family transport system permease protein